MRMGMTAMITRVGMVVVVLMGMPGPTPGIGPAFGVEGCPDMAHMPAKARYHIGNHMVMPHKDALRRNGGGKVPVAQVPRQPQQVQRVMGGDFHQVFRQGFNPNDAAIVKHQPIAIGQQAGVFKFKQHARARA